MPEAATKQKGELTPISRTATVLLVLFSAWMWIETLGILASIVPPMETSGFLATVAQAFRSYWWLLIPVIALVAGWMIQSGLRRDRFCRAAVVALVSFVVTGAAVGVSIVFSAAPLMSFIRMIRTVGSG